MISKMDWMVQMDAKHGQLKDESKKKAFSTTGDE